jgi:DNA-binding FadR family transcriptional regulator
VKTESSPSEQSSRFADRVYEQILEEIVSGQSAIGDRLPSEDQLAKEHSVSRPVIREALSRLQADGVVITRKGAGTFVQRQPGREFGGIADLMRCFEFRIGVEGEAAYLAAQRRTDEHMAAIRAAFDRLNEANAASELGVREDIELHVGIARASRNQMFVQTLDALAVHVFNGMNVTRSLSLTRSQKRLRLVQEEHRRIIEAIFASDGELSRAAMREHIDNARHRALGDSVEPEED